MPIKSNQTAKSGQTAKTSKSGANKVVSKSTASTKTHPIQKVAIAPKSTASSTAATGTVAKAKSAVANSVPAKTSASKPQTKTNALAASTASGKPIGSAVPAPGKTSPIAAGKSQASPRPAAVSTQKHDTVKSSLQQRTPMATSTASKVALQPKAPLKNVDVKAVIAKSAAKAAPAEKVSTAKPAGLSAAVVAATQTATVRPAAARAMPAAVSAVAAQRISAPAAPSAVVTPKDVAQKAQQAAAGPKKAVSTRHGFKINELVVYPAHGVGRIVAIEEQEIAGMALELFVITFEKDKMTLRVPTGRSMSVMRKLAEDGVVKRAMETLKGKARIKRTMWSRRAQEFEQKINSGDLVSIAEVVRDLFRAETQPEQSYSERQLYEAALDRMAREIAAVEKIDERGAVQRVTEVLSKSAKSRRAESDATAAAGDIKAA